MSVGRICVREVFLARPDESAEAAAQRMVKEGVGTLVVLDGNGRPIGILTDRDLMARCVAEGAQPAATPVHAVMSAPAALVRETTPIEEALSRMVSLRVRRLPVIDAEDRLSGILALDDVLELLAEEMAAVGRVVQRSRGRSA